jgi:hypothetical protein
VATRAGAHRLGGLSLRRSAELHESLSIAFLMLLEQVSVFDCRGCDVVIRIASIVLRVCGGLALLLGLLFWLGIARNFLMFHMLLGVLVVLSLWVIGVVQAAAGGSWPMAAGALLLGALVAALGMTQASLLLGPLHWVIQAVHLLLGAAAIGFGQAMVARRAVGALPAPAT